MGTLTGLDCGGNILENGDCASGFVKSDITPSTTGFEKLELNSVGTTIADWTFVGAHTFSGGGTMIGASKLTVALNASLDFGTGTLLADDSSAKTITNFGTFIGNVTFGSGDDMVIVGAGATFGAGTWEGGGGTNRLELGGDATAITPTFTFSGAQFKNFVAACMDENATVATAEYPI